VHTKVMYYVFSDSRSADVLKSKMVFPVQKPIPPTTDYIILLIYKIAKRDNVMLGSTPTKVGF